MKKNILAIAIATAVAAPAAMADAKIYGYFNTALENVSEKGTTWDNRNSRIGIKGSEDLGNGLKAVYQFETGVNINKGSWNDREDGGARNTFLGLAGNFGTVIAGRHDTPLRMIQPTDHFADSKYVGTNRSKFNQNYYNGVVKGTPLSGEQRLDNVLAYLSPNFNGVSFAVALAQGKEGNDGVEEKDINPTNAFSASVSYGKKSDGLYLAAAITKASDKFGSSVTTVDNADLGLDANHKAEVDKATIARLTAQYRSDGLTANIMYNRANATVKNGVNTAANLDGKQKGESITLGFAYDIDAFTPKAKIAHVKQKPAGIKSESWTNFALGLDYKLGKNTKTFVEVAQIDKKQAEVQKNGKNKAATVFSIGMNHKF